MDIHSYRDMHGKTYTNTDIHLYKIIHDNNITHNPVNELITHNIHKKTTKVNLLVE